MPETARWGSTGPLSCGTRDIDDFETLGVEPAVLTEGEIIRYREDGLVVPAGFRLPEAQVERLSLAVERVVERNPDTPSDLLFNLHYENAPPLHNLGDPAFRDLVRDAGLLDMVEQLIGPDLILWASQLFCKEATRGREVPFHQDSRYWAVRPLSTCSVWVAIDPSFSENGALKFLPGSHKLGNFSHRTDMRSEFALNQAIDDRRFDANAARLVELEAGQVSLHDAHLVHGSAANHSGRRRAGLAIRYMPATSTIQRDLDMREVSRLDWAVLPVSLVRGMNRNAANDFSVGGPDF